MAIDCMVDDKYLTPTSLSSSEWSLHLDDKMIYQDPMRLLPGLEATSACSMRFDMYLSESWNGSSQIIIIYGYLWVLNWYFISSFVGTDQLKQISTLWHSGNLT